MSENVETIMGEVTLVTVLLHAVQISIVGHIGCVTQEGLDLSCPSSRKMRRHTAVLLHTFTYEASIATKHALIRGRKRKAHIHRRETPQG